MRINNFLFSLMLQRARLPPTLFSYHCAWCYSMLIGIEAGCMFCPSMFDSGGKELKKESGKWIQGSNSHMWLLWSNSRIWLPMKQFPHENLIKQFPHVTPMKQFSHVTPMKLNNLRYYSNFNLNWYTISSCERLGREFVSATLWDSIPTSVGIINRINN